MADTKVDVDPDKLYVSNGNLLDKARKDFKEWLDVKVFRLALEVPLDKVLPNPARLEVTIGKHCKVMEKEMYEKVDKLSKDLAALKKDEDAGSSKAAAEAEKRVKEVDKEFKRAADEAGGEIRKVIQREIFKMTGEKPTLRSVSQTFFRGLDLQEGVFSGGESNEYVPYLKEIAKSLAGMTKDLVKKATDEKSLRNDVAGELGRYMSLIIAAKKSAPDLDLKEFYKSNHKDAKKIEDAGAKYSDLLRGIQELFEKIVDEVKKLDKLRASDDTLKKDKDVKSSADKFFDAVNSVVSICPARLTMAAAAVKMPKNGEDEKAFSREAAVFAGLKGVAKPAKEAEQAAKDLEGEAKDAAK